MSKPDMTEREAKYIADHINHVLREGGQHGTIDWRSILGASLGFDVTNVAPETVVMVRDILAQEN